MLCVLQKDMDEGHRRSAQGTEEPRAQTPQSGVSLCLYLSTQDSDARCKGEAWGLKYNGAQRREHFCFAHHQLDSIPSIPFGP